MPVLLPPPIAQGSPRISVITPCMNAARYLAEAIESVLAQARPDVEHIVVDGGSTDDTLKVLARYPNLKVIGGPDQGIYDALNKGLAVARGSIVGFLNADDRYAPDAFAAIDDAMEDESTMAVLGKAVFFRDAVPAGREEVDRFSPTGADLLMLSTLRSPMFNAWFFRRALFAKIGHLDMGYRIAGDREFMLRFALSGLPFVTTERAICQYRIHEGSLTFSGKAHVGESIAREHIRMTAHYLDKPDLSVRARHLIRQARTRDMLQMAIRAARHREMGPLMFYCMAGTRRDPMWIAHFLKRAIAALARRVAAGAGFPRQPRPKVQ
jgi:glycosyltransferase involved in cell wall biosynthesis